MTRFELEPPCCCISRNISETVEPSKIIPTIALQLAESFPAAAHIINNVLKGGFPPSLKEQVDTLLLAPIQELSKSCDIIIIVIDALDELLNAAQSVPEILSIIAPLDCDLPDSVRFLITSRPEHWSNVSKSKNVKLTVFKQDLLVTESSLLDVHKFIIARMQNITPDRPGWVNWSESGELMKLSSKANGLFQYAATALHWIEDQIYNHEKACQNAVFEQFTPLGIGELEALYKVILMSFVGIVSDVDEVENKQARSVLDLHRRNKLCGFQHVIGTILVLQHRMKGISSILIKAKEVLNLRLPPQPVSNVCFSSIAIQIPFESIWTHGLLPTWDSDQSTLPIGSSHLVL
ncbi:hypothetical protein C8R45DRAFT_935692 [Mycena sanguinolenta]|nr:hypothetical protein C8R45DRAFT_935692 [Mycena sanguinolenta]